MPTLRQIFWGNALSKWMSSILGVAAVTTTVVVPAWSALELPVPVFDKTLRKVVEPITLAQSQQNAALDQLLLYQLNQQLADAMRDPAAATSAIVQQRINELRQQIGATQQRINSSRR